MTAEGLLAQVVKRAAVAGFDARLLAEVVAEHRTELLRLVGRKTEPQTLNEDRIVTLNLGLGRDSIAMLCLLADGRLRVGGWRVTKQEVDAVVFSDTGAEWRHTYALLPRIRRFCKKNGLRLLVLQKPSEARDFLDTLPAPGQPGRKQALQHRPWRESAPATIEEKAASGWYHLLGDIIDEYESRSTIASRAKKDCTDNHKIQPIRKVLEDLAVERFGVDHRAWGRLVRSGERRPHLTLIGIAADESKRAIDAHPLRGGDGPWYVEEAYPLLEMGIAKADEGAVLEECGFADVRKSGCRMCPFQPVGWFWALRETDPPAWSEVVAYEEKALERNPRMFVAGDAPLPVVVERWRLKNPDATPQAVLEKSYQRCG